MISACKIFRVPTHLTNIDVALHDGVVCSLVNTARFHTQEGWLEESLRASEPLIPNGDHLSVGKLIRFLQRAGACSSSHLLLKVEGDVAELLLDVTNDFPLSR